MVISFRNIKMLEIELVSTQKSIVFVVISKIAADLQFSLKRISIFLSCQFGTILCEQQQKILCQDVCEG
jgi:hypothetical protein